MAWFSVIIPHGSSNPGGSEAISKRRWSCEEARETFKEEIADVEYRPLLPPDQKPPLELNRAIMERYRQLMQKHYSKEKPAFR